MELDRLFRHILTGRVAIMLGLVLVPTALLVALGTLWLAEHDVLIPFLLGFAGLYATFRLVLFVLRRRVRSDPPRAGRPVVSANPEWKEAEHAVFQRLCSGIASSLSQPLPWPALQNEAMGIMERAARDLSAGKKGALDFSIPEALLLADRVVSRLRGDLRRYLPLADQVRIGTLLWLWSHRQKLQIGAHVAWSAWRVKRLLANPVGALLQEVQSVLLSPVNNELQTAGQAGLQRVILEEIAAAAIDLHAGYLRYTEAELLEIDLAATEADQGRLLADDQPLRLLVVGQVSAGKSTLINLLTGLHRSETDMAPTTAGLVAHPMVLDGEDLTVVDTAGINGSRPVEDLLLVELMQADLVIWVLKANRPARAPDVALLKRLRQSCDEQGRRRPPIIVALTGVDLLLNAWPYQENLLPPQGLALVSEVITAVAKDLDEARLVPLSLEMPHWNLNALSDLIVSSIPEALMVQRNRRRLERKVSPGAEIAKGIDGLGQAAKFVIGRWRQGK